MIIHPSMLIRVDLDERLYSKDVAADVVRAYDHIAHTLVRSRPATDPVCNTMALKVTSSRSYWDDSDERQAQMWPSVRDWLRAKVHFVGENIKAFNKTRGEAGNPTISYGQLVLETNPYTFVLALNEASQLPPFDKICDEFHAHLNRGAFEGVDVAQVRAPSAAACAALQDAQAPVAEGEEARPEQAGGELAEDTGAPSQTIDYSVWDIVASDGTVRAFDATAGRWA